MKSSWDLGDLLRIKGMQLLGKTSNAAKQRWNKEHYTQIKVSVQPEIAEAFKEKCKSDGVSMASEITKFMCGQCGIQNPPEPTFKVTTRQRRRKALAALIEQLEVIMDAESQYMDNIPENLQNSIRHEAASLSIQALQNAIDNLNEVYE